MRVENLYAIIALFSIVITLYSMKSNQAHYLPDLFGLALALAAPRQLLAVGAVAIVVAVRHTPLAYGVAELVPSWLHIVLLPAAHYMSRQLDDQAAQLESSAGGVSEPEITTGNTEILQPVEEFAAEHICLGETRALARLVVAGEIKLTVAVKVGAAAKSGPKYQKRTRQIQAEVERMTNHYPAGSSLKPYLPK